MLCWEIRKQWSLYILYISYISPIVFCVDSEWELCASFKKSTNSVHCICGTCIRVQLASELSLCLSFQATSRRSTALLISIWFKSYGFNREIMPIYHLYHMISHRHTHHITVTFSKTYCMSLPFHSPIFQLDNSCVCIFLNNPLFKGRRHVTCAVICIVSIRLYTHMSSTSFTISAHTSICAVLALYKYLIIASNDLRLKQT